MELERAGIRALLFRERTLRPSHSDRIVELLGKAIDQVSIVLNFFFAYVTPDKLSAFSWRVFPPSLIFASKARSLSYRGKVIRVGSDFTRKYLTTRERFEKDKRISFLRLRQKEQIE
jgi:hypothetical protein